MVHTAAKVVAVIVAGAGLVVGGVFLSRKASVEAERKQEAAIEHKPASTSVELVPGYTNRIRIAERLVETLGVRFAKATEAPPAHPLKLAGSLFPDSQRLAR